MAFSFNFAVPGSDGTIADLPAGGPLSKQDINPVATETSKEVFIPKNYEPSDYDVLQITMPSGENIQYIDSHIIEQNLKNGEYDSKNEHSSLGDALTSGSDLQANVYEGGLKIWECSIDLVHYLAEDGVQLAGTSVLEVGCGAGIPGLYAYHKGATVHFTDYNWEVLKYITIPNVLFNTEAESDEEIQRCRFFSGDWTSLTDLLCNDSKFVKYDLIFTSETIYNPQNYPKLLTLMEKVLKPSGSIFLAAKTHYFGVGGSIELFKAEVSKSNVFNFNEVKVFEEGIQRKIIKLDFKKR